MKALGRLLLVAVATATTWLIRLPAEAATAHPVLTTLAGEFQPARGPNHLAWEQNTKGQPNHYDVLVRAPGGGPVRVNGGRSNGAMGGIDDDLLVYQQYRKKRSDLFFYDLNTGQRSKLPKKVNSKQWEYWPSISEPWLLFGRWKMSNDARRLILHNLETGERRVLNRIRGRKAFIGPGQVNGDYVVWWRCPTKGRCQVYRYQISTATRVKIPNPGSYQRAPSVNAEGTVFLARGGKACGGQVRIVRVAPDGTETILTQFPEGLDSRDTYAYTDEGGVTHVHYERFGCGRKAGSDIYQVMDPELASLTVNLGGTGTGTVSSSPAGILCGTDCSESYPSGQQVTIQATPDPGSYFAGWTGGGCSGTSPCTLTMDEARSVTATFELTGSITVIKDAIPDDPQDFVFDPSPNLQAASFTLDDDADGTLLHEQTFAGLVAGTYTVQEVSIPSGWQVADLECLGDSDGDTTTGTILATINLDPGEDIVCTYVNAREGSITAIKDALPDDPENFEFDPSSNLQTTNFFLDDDSAGPLPNQETFEELDVPDTYTVREVNIPTGWELTEVDCAGGGPDTSGSVGTATATIGLDAGEAVVCTFENTEEGSITIVKDAVDDDPQDFGFTTTGLNPATFTLDDDAAGSNQQTFTGLLPGSYSVSEDADPAGWQLTDITCVGGGGNTSDAGRTATIGLDAGEDVVCTFTNTEEGTITIVKDAQPNDDQDFEFDPSASLDPGPNILLDDDADPTLSNQRLYADLLPGMYSVTEVNIPASWSLTALSCAGGGGNTTTLGATATMGLDPGEDVTCTFTNTGEGSITIVKDAVPNDPQDFGFSATGGLTPSAFSLDDDADGTLSNSRTFTAVDASTYSVTEDADPSGWQLTNLDCVGGGANTSVAGGTATIGLDPGESVTCTFQNTKDGKIIVAKEANPDASAQSFEFDTDYGPNFFLQDGQTHDSGFLDPGTYSVSELTPSGWSLTASSCSDGSSPSSIGLSPGEIVTCTFTNTEEGSITVVKDAVDDDPQDFGFSTTGLTPTTFTLDDDGAGSNQQSFTGLLPGTFTVSEDADPSGWQLTDISCVGGGPDTTDSGRTATIGLDAGEDVVCTFENTEEGSITIVLDAVPDDPEDFDFSAGGGLSPSAFTLDDDDDLPSPSGTPDNQTFPGVLPGTYTVTETIPVLWSLNSIVCVDPDSGSSGNTGTGTATVDLDPGEAVTCTFTNSLL